ncbi:MAG: hypothetical protein AAFX55_18540, partial [Bacteroidota bacterium]
MDDISYNSKNLSNSIDAFDKQFLALRNSLTFEEQTLLNKSLNKRNTVNHKLHDNLDKILIELQKSNKKSQ